jgi:glutathione S-transferase
MELVIVGRSSSHFTRSLRVFAHELDVRYLFRTVANLTSRNAHDYGDNPALKLPVLETPDGPWFGAINCCRELARRAPSAPKIVWPEQANDRLAANAQELVLQGMATEVSMIMQTLSRPGSMLEGDSKQRSSLENSLTWLDAHLPGVLERVAPEGVVSVLEVTAFCFVTHLEFRSVTDLGPYSALRAFCERFSRRASARATPYCFDV